jgi:uncharacterized protein (TIGR02453 family)
MAETPNFAFPADTIEFLADLRAHNEKAWFDANRDRYEAAYLDPAKTFVQTVAPALDRIVPGIRAEPKVLGSIFRINRDTRFGTDKRPYKDHLDFWFWEGDRKAAVSGLFLRIAPEEVVVGAGAHGFAKGQLRAYRSAVGNPGVGGELTSIVTGLERSGYGIGGETYVRTPRGYPVEGDAERLLRHSALYVHDALPAEAATRDDLPAELITRWTPFARLHRWLVTNLDTTPV